MQPFLGANADAKVRVEIIVAKYYFCLVLWQLTKKTRRFTITCTFTLLMNMERGPDDTDD